MYAFAEEMLLFSGGDTGFELITTVPSVRVPNLVKGIVKIIGIFPVTIICQGLQFQELRLQGYPDRIIGCWRPVQTDQGGKKGPSRTEIVLPDLFNLYIGIRAPVNSHRGMPGIPVSWIKGC